MELPDGQMHRFKVNCYEKVALQEDIPHKDARPGILTGKNETGSRLSEQPDSEHQRVICMHRYPQQSNQGEQSPAMPNFPS